MEFEYSLDYFNNFDKLYFKKKNSVLDAAFKFSKIYNYKLQNLSHNFIKYILYLIVLNIYNDKNLYDRKYLKEEIDFINDVIKDRIDLPLNNTYNSIVNNYLFYTKTYNDVNISYERSKNNLHIKMNDNVLINVYCYYCILLNYNINVCFYLRILSKNIIKQYSQYYLILLFILWKNIDSENLDEDGIEKYADRYYSDFKHFKDLLITVNDFFYKNNNEEHLVRYLYFAQIYDIFEKNQEYFNDYINNIYNIIEDIKNLFDYNNSEAISKLKIILTENFESHNIVEKLNYEIFQKLKENGFDSLSEEYFNIEIENMFKEFINKIRENSRSTDIFDTNYKIYIENFTKRSYQDFFFNIEEKKVQSFDNIINIKYYKFLLSIEDDYYMIYLNILENLRKKDSGGNKVSVAQLYYNLEDMTFNYYFGKNLFQVKYLQNGAEIFFNEFLLILDKINYINSLSAGRKMTDFIGNQYNINNFSFIKNENIFSNFETNNLISGISAFSDFTFNNPQFKNLFFNNFRSSSENDEYINDKINKLLQSV